MMKLYNPNRLNAFLVPLIALGVPLALAALSVDRTVTSPTCATDPNVIEMALNHQSIKPVGGPIQCPDVKALIANPGALIHPTPAKDECPDKFAEAVNGGLATPSYRGTCDQLAKMVKVRTDSGVWPK